MVHGAQQWLRRSSIACQRPGAGVVEQRRPGLSGRDRGGGRPSRAGGRQPAAGVSTEILCTAAQRLWRPAPDCGLPTGAQKGEYLAELITTAWLEAAARPCAQDTGSHALSCVERRVAAHDAESPSTTWASSCARNPLAS